MKKTLSQLSVRRLVLLIIVCTLSLLALTLPIAIRPDYYQISIGDVSAIDILAPSNISFESTILTEQARDTSSENIQDIYFPPDPNISRQQLEYLNNLLIFIDLIREDPYSTSEFAISDLSSIENENFTIELLEDLLNETDGSWLLIRQEALRILEVNMRNPITNINVNNVRSAIPSSISLSMTPTQSVIVAAIVEPFIIPNSFIDDVSTLSQREAARNDTPVVTSTFIAGESIVQNGQVISPLVWEALNQFGLNQRDIFGNEFWASLSIILVCSFFTMVYFSYRTLKIFQEFRILLVISFLFIIFLFSAKLLIPNRTVIPYLFPLPAFGLTIGVLFSLETGMLFSVLLSILATFGLTNNLELSIFYILTSFCGILILGRGRRVAAFFLSGLAIAITGIGIIIAYRLPDTLTDLLGMTTLFMAAIFCGFASSSLTLLLQYFFSLLLKLTTSLQLLDLSRPDHPLLQFMLRNSPGTYQHSLQVSNLAEQAAESIGADPLLTRVGALYHDAGKALNPSYFIENIIPGNDNPHENLDPSVSARIIIQHVYDGITLAIKYRIPPSIRSFISEHHGTLLARYQYSRALEFVDNIKENIDESIFRYPGPKPQTKETALLMLADGCEARARAELPKDDEQLRKTISKVIDFCLQKDQLSSSNLSLKDLSLVSESFFLTLRNVYHPRIQYPDLPPDKK